MVQSKPACRKVHREQSEPTTEFPGAVLRRDLLFSVFTHLNEAMQDHWLDELRRVLKPGGVLLFSVHGEAAAKTLDWQF
jgi:SAM-dependent methyltransferase